MQHTKFQGPQSIGCIEDVKMFVPYMDVVAILVM